MTKPAYRWNLAVLLTLWGLAAAAGGLADEPGQSKAKDKLPSYAQPQPGRLEWFQDLKFGLFMHWGKTLVKEGRSSQDPMTKEC